MHASAASTDKTVIFGTFVLVQPEMGLFLTVFAQKSSKNSHFRHFSGPLLTKSGPGALAPDQQWQGRQNGQKVAILAISGHFDGFQPETGWFFHHFCQKCQKNR